MKRFFFSLAALALTTSVLDASNGPRGGSSNAGRSSGGRVTSGRVISGSSGKVTSPGTKIGSTGSKTTSGDSGTKTSGNGAKSTDGGSKVFDKKTGDKKLGDGSAKSPILDKPILDKKGGQNIADKFATTKKFDLQGNKNIAKKPGFKGDHKLHAAYCGKYHLPGHLHNHCYFHHDFCWNHCCWLPHHNTCGYWHPYARCWYYWYEPYHCYLPYSYVEQYRPVVVAAAEQAPVVVNVTNNNTSVSDTEVDPLEVTPTLPPGAVASLPAGVNPVLPIIPTPEE